MKFRNAALFVVLAVAWGSAFTAIKAGLEYFPPVLFAAVRYDLAAIVMLLYALYATSHWRPTSAREWVLVGVGALFPIAGYHSFLFIGQQGTTSAAAAIIVSLSPILTTGFARVLIPDERLTILGLLGLLIGFVGVVILSNPDPDNLLDTRTVSMLLIFCAAVSFALGSVLIQRIRIEMPIETLQAWSMLIGALLMHVVSLAIGESPGDIEWTGEAVIALGYLVIVASVLGFLIFFDLLNRLGSIQINLVSYAAPIAAAVTGVIFLGEIPLIHSGIGFGFILIGFGLIKREAIRQAVVRHRTAE